MKSILFCICLALSVTLFSQERRLALVIGNNSYKNGDVVDNAVSDAYLMSFTLEDLGFDVISVTNASYGEMEDAIINFWKQLAGYDVALIYYAGHGIQFEGVNYLIPVDAKLKQPDDLKKEAIDAGRMVSQFENLSTRINMAILDACGNDPFRPWTEEGAEGLATMTAPAGSIIVFTTSPGTSVPEGTGSNGLYVESLTRQMMIPQPIENVFTNTRLLVNHSSKGKQNPKEWSQFTGSFSLIGGYATPVRSSGSIVLTSQITGDLYLNGLEIASVEPNTVIPLDNIEAGSYDLKISGQDTWEDVVLVLGNQITNVTATAVSAKKIPIGNGEIFIDNRDLHEYPWMEYGSQTWMTMNLSFDASDGSYCYEDDESNCEDYGRLYTWEAAQKACPEGWHLPSDEEWMALELAIGMKKGATKRIGLRGKMEGSILKDTIQGHWVSLEGITSNSNGFNALPGGYNLSETKSVEKEKSTIFWTSTEYSFESAYYRKIEDSKGGIHRYYSKKYKGYAVRCVRD